MSTQHEEIFAQATKIKHERPSLYKVILHNDDYTPMDFVVFVLEMIFNKNSDDANNIMMSIHQKGGAICGAYPRAIAETKIVQVTQMSEDSEYPLKCSMEKE